MAYEARLYIDGLFTFVEDFTYSQKYFTNGIILELGKDEGNTFLS